MAAFAGTLQLVFDFGGRARDHGALQQKYYELIAQIAEDQNPNESMIAKWERDLFQIYAEEPAPMRALDAIAYNATESLGIGKRVKIKWYHTLLSQIWPFNQTEFPYDSLATSDSASTR